MKDLAIKDDQKKQDTKDDKEQVCAFLTSLQEFQPNLGLPPPHHLSTVDHHCHRNCPPPFFLPWLAQVFEGRLVEGDLKSGGHVLQASSGTGSSRQTFNYSTDRVVGNGSFGVVFQATCLETGETVRRSTRPAL